MNVLRIALGQVNPTVGDLEGNARLIRQAAADAAAGQADLLILPEMVLTGYPVEDLSLRPSFQQASRLAMSALARDIADDGFADLTCLIGYLDHSDDDDDAICKKEITRRSDSGAASLSAPSTKAMKAQVWSPCLCSFASAPAAAMTTTVCLTIDFHRSDE